jgi:hypothetical protein
VGNGCRLNELLRSMSPFEPWMITLHTSRKAEQSQWLITATSTLTYCNWCH